LSRSLSGLVGAELGLARDVPGGHCALDLVVMTIVWWTLPKTVTTTDVSYFQLLAFRRQTRGVIPSNRSLGERIRSWKVAALSVDL
jgi:hypothetical protein